MPHCRHAARAGAYLAPARFGRAEPDLEQQRNEIIYTALNFIQIQHLHPSHASCGRWEQACFACNTLLCLMHKRTGVSCIQAILLTAMGLPQVVGGDLALRVRHVVGVLAGRSGGAKDIPVAQRVLRQASRLHCSLDAARRSPASAAAAEAPASGPQPDQRASGSVDGEDRSAASTAAGKAPAPGPQPEQRGAGSLHGGGGRESREAAGDEGAGAARREAEGAGPEAAAGAAPGCQAPAAAGSTALEDAGWVVAGRTAQRDGAAGSTVSAEPSGERDGAFLAAQSAREADKAWLDAAAAAEDEGDGGEAGEDEAEAGGQGEEVPARQAQGPRLAEETGDVRLAIAAAEQLFPQGEDEGVLGALVAFAYPDRVAQRRDRGNRCASSCSLLPFLTCMRCSGLCSSVGCALVIFREYPTCQNRRVMQQWDSTLSYLHMPTGVLHKALT